MIIANRMIGLWKTLPSGTWVMCSRNAPIFNPTVSSCPFLLFGLTFWPYLLAPGFCGVDFNSSRSLLLLPCPPPRLANVYFRLSRYLLPISTQAPSVCTLWKKVNLKIWKSLTLLLAQLSALLALFLHFSNAFSSIIDNLPAPPPFTFNLTLSTALFLLTTITKVQIDFLRYHFILVQYFLFNLNRLKSRISRLQVLLELQRRSPSITKPLLRQNIAFEYTYRFGILKTFSKLRDELIIW